MAWRNQGITGSNNIPLGKTRRFGGGGDDEDGMSVGSGLSELKRGRSPEARPLDVEAPKRRKKRNRWGDASENKAAGLMGLPTAITAPMTTEQLEAYTLHLRIEEITQKLKINDVVPADGDRSPSPPPQYNNYGVRINTREYRYRKRLEDERHKLVEKAIKVIPNYHPPQDYRRPTKTQEKVYVPVNDYPEINFSMIADLLVLPTNLFPSICCPSCPPNPLSSWLGCCPEDPSPGFRPTAASALGCGDLSQAGLNELVLTRSFLSSPLKSWLTHWPPWQHSQENGIRIRCKNCHPWQGLCQGGQGPF